jgi:acyl-CoA oxidase
MIPSARYKITAGFYLGRAVTIAVRYAAVRRQTAPAPGALSPHTSCCFARPATPLSPLLPLAKLPPSKTKTKTKLEPNANKTGERELQVLDYQNTAGTLLPLVARAYALWLMGAEMRAAYKR